MNTRKVKLYEVPNGRHRGKIRISFIEDNTQRHAMLLSETDDDDLFTMATDWVLHGKLPQ